MIKSAVMKDTGSRWYVDYREFNPEAKAWERKRAYGFVNKEKDLDKRRVLLQDLYNELIASFGRKATEKVQDHSIKKYIQNYIADKSLTLRKSSIKNIKLALKYFYGFLKSKNYHELPLSAISKQHIHEFRIELAKHTGNRSVNNHVDFVKSFFEYHIDNYNDLLYKNPGKKAAKLPVTTERHMAYSQKEVKKYFQFMQETDPQLLLYCQFIGMGFLRCNEARSLKISDLDFENKTITLWGKNAKTRTRKVKPMMEIFYRILIKNNLNRYPGSYFVFSYGGEPGPKQVHGNCFQKRYKKVKNNFGISKKYTVYGFRHSFVQRMLKKGGIWTEIMKYTGHDTMEAFWAYAKALLNEPAQDLSSLLDDSFIETGKVPHLQS